MQAETLRAAKISLLFFTALPLPVLMLKSSSPVGGNALVQAVLLMINAGLVLISLILILGLRRNVRALLLPAMVVLGAIAVLFTGLGVGVAIAGLVRGSLRPAEALGALLLFGGPGTMLALATERLCACYRFMGTPAGRRRRKNGGRGQRRPDEAAETIAEEGEAVALNDNGARVATTETSADADAGDELQNNNDNAELTLSVEVEPPDFDQWL